MFYLQVGPVVAASFKTKPHAMQALKYFAIGVRVEIKETRYKGVCSGPKRTTSDKIRYLKPGEFLLS
jgi:hypothetical protein